MDGPVHVQLDKLLKHLGLRFDRLQILMANPQGRQDTPQILMGLHPSPPQRVAVVHVDSILVQGEDAYSLEVKTDVDSQKSQKCVGAVGEATRTNLAPQ